MSLTERRFSNVQALAFAAGGALLAVTLLGAIHYFARVRNLVLPAPPPTNPPVKVRGGAMTFRSAAPFTLYNSTYCVPIQPNTRLLLYEPGDPSTAAYSTPLTKGMQIDFYGHTADGTKASANGVQVLIVGDCGGKFGAVITPESSNFSSFYPLNDMKKDDDNTYRRRFWDTSMSCDSAPTPTADEDTCEHLSAVSVGGASWPCTDGECDVVIGN